MSSRIRRPVDDDPYGVQTGTACGSRGPGGLSSRRLEQDMDVELEADVEYFDHPQLGRIRLQDVLVCGLGAPYLAEPEELDFP